MSASPNPLTGASWGTTPVQPTGGGASNMPWLQQSPSTNPGGYGNPKGANEINRNMGLTNIAAGQMKNQLASLFAPLMQQYGGQAANFFQNLMNLGSPYYQQHQTEGFNQQLNQNQNAAAMAKQQLASQGYGNTPSGANAAMIGGMNQAGAQSMAEQYLQNLFANEALQSQGAAGIANLAGMFNPGQMLGGTSIGANVQAPPTFFQNFDAMAQGIGSLMGGGGALAGGIQGNKP